MTKRFVIVGLLLAVLIGGLGYFQFVFKPEMIRGFISKAPRPVAVVGAEVARRETWTGRLSAIGTLVSIQGVDVASQVGGLVKGVGFDSGVTVEAGTVLVELDTAVEQADLASATATLREAELAYERQTDLIRKAVTSEANVDTARAKRDTTAAQVNKINALLAQKTIKAPFAGRLGIRKVEIGQYVAPGAALVTLQALDPIRVDFPVPEQTLAGLRTGQGIELAVDAYPGVVFRGEIEARDARVAQETRTLLVRGRLANPEKKLLPGMFANVSVLDDTPKDVVTVPRTAVTYSLYGDSVYVVKEAQAAPAAQPAGAAQASPVPPTSAAPKPGADLVVERRFIRVGQTQEDRVSVIEGLTAGEQVVTTGQLKLVPGARVRVDTTQPLKRPDIRQKL